MSEQWEWTDGGEHYRAPNPYYEPEACGLEIVANMDDPEAFYDFEMAIVWRDRASGRLYLGTDSGCSCPTPFEDFRSLADLTLVEALEQVRDVVRAREKSDGYGRWPKRSVDDFLESVERALGARSVSGERGEPT